MFSSVPNFLSGILAIIIALTSLSGGLVTGGADRPFTVEFGIEQLEGDPALKEYRGRGLMIGLEIKAEYAGLRDRLLFEKHIFTGASGANVIRLLPALNLPEAGAQQFMEAWKALTQ